MTAVTRFGQGRPCDPEEGHAGSGRKITKKFMVSGHYRLQPHGPGRTQRRLQFIEPFEKGPDAAELMSRTYHVPDQDRAMPDERWEEPDQDHDGPGM